LRIADAVTFLEPVGQREEERNECLLIFGVNMKNIETDALRFARFVEQTVALGFFERRGNCVFVERFQFAHALQKLESQKS
jgi:hypothetical protein